MPKIDLLYMTRIQEERFEDKWEYKKVREGYALRSSWLEKAKPTMKVFAPLPRLQEIPQEIDNSPHAYYFQQASNGLYVRQALLGLILGKL